MPINFDDNEILAQYESEFDAFSPERKMQIDGLAAMLFANMKLVGLGAELPETVPDLNRKHLARLRLLASTMQAVYGMAALSVRRSHK